MVFRKKTPEKELKEIPETPVESAPIGHIETETEVSELEYLKSFVNEMTDTEYRAQILGLLLEIRQKILGVESEDSPK
jgi:hypothetical protein